MVKICPFSYPTENEIIYNIFYQQFKFPLHDFQKWAVESIVTGNHVLITAPTGTGKTVPAEFALNYFHSIGKKTIYTCPIKALSNEKFYDFTKKFPHINIGLVTGDISCNPNADVIIMTLEILMNKLYNKNMNNKTTSFELDIELELGCVVFDEIHFINDEKRGTNWEQTIMMLPEHIQIIGLSATLDHPENFAKWLENTLNNNSVESSVVEKQVYLCRKLIRSVPLIHYSFISSNSSVNKIIKDKALQQEIQQVVNKPIVIQNEKNIFNDVNYQKINKILNLFHKNDIRINRRHILNKVSEYLVENEMLPALCYVFSRKQLEICAEELTQNLLEFDSKVPYTVDYECEQILRKLPNYQEYLQLPDYIKTIQLFRKGVGMHHAGLIPILREMTELLFAKGYIKILFCTETMSIGINLPVKTTIFTDINKFNGDTLRTLYSHEYTQASGRAGRLGLDSVGHVIHLTNLFRNVDSISIKEMMKGIPQKLFSKFNISYNLLLNLIKTDKNMDEFMNLSMVNVEINNYINEYENILKQKQKQKEEKNIFYRTPEEIIHEYIELKNKKNELVNKKRKEVERKIQNIQENYIFIEQDLDLYLQKQYLESEISDFENKIVRSKKYLTDKKNIIFNKLLNDEYICRESDDLDKLEEKEKKYILTLKGQVASNIREVHCLIFSNIIFFNSKLHLLNTNEIIGFLSCFTNISVSDDKKCILPDSTSKTLNIFINEIVQLYNEFKDFENVNGIQFDNDNEIHFELINYLIDWTKCETDMECKEVLQKLATEKNIFSGEFIKAVLKINNIVEELKNVCEIIGLMDLYNKLNEIPGMTLKYIVTNQSLYV